MQPRPPNDTQASKLRQIDSIATAEPIGSLNFALHSGLLLFGGIGTIWLFGAWSIAAIVVVYVSALTLEKAVAVWASRTRNAALYWPVLGLLFLRAAACNLLVVWVWAEDGDIFKMAALALLIAATINIFVYHATYPRIIACVVIPIAFGFGAIAWMFYLEFGLSPEFLAAAVIFICTAPYCALSLVQAIKRWEELEVTRNALSQSQKQDALGKLVSGVAHDFNNILAVTLGNAEMLKDATGAKKDMLADEIIKAAERGSSLSGQLLAFGRRSQLAPATHHVNGIFHNLHAMLDRVLPENIATTMTVAEDMPLIFVDRRQLETALLNLAINARDAMPDGGTLIITAGPCSSATLEAQLDPDELAEGRFVCIEVSDTGIGVSSDMQKDVFDPFFTTKAVGQGSGLGLSMVLGFAKQSGGTVRFKSAPGRGTKVSLFLPISDDQTALSPTQSRAQDCSATARILLVEDEPPLRDVFARQLRAAGYDVTTANCGQDAEILLSTGLQPDLLLTDLVMPGQIQGHELAQRARTHVPGIPIVLVSGYSDDALNCADPWANSLTLLRKPVRQEKLLSTIEATLADPLNANKAPVGAA